MSVRENRSGKQTKEWILETACKLFNEHGSQAISTKRIAKEMGISPGNLYYHFKNKEEIIRALLEDSLGTFLDGWNNPQIPPLQRFFEIINQIIRAWQECRFFKKELVVLLNNDPELKALYTKHEQIILDKSRALFEELIEAGMIRLHDIQVFESLITISWIIVQFWLNFLEVYDRPLTEANFRTGSDLIIQVWRPYFSEEALDELNRMNSR